MASSLDKLKVAVGAGARANKYQIFLGSISGVNLGSETDLLCKATTFPGKTIGQIEVWNQGRKFIMPGDTSYSNTWTVTFYGTENHALRKEFIKWMAAADDFQNNKHAGTPSTVMTSMKVAQLNSQAEVTAEYEFANVFVQDIGEISVGDDSADTLVEFDVTFSFTDWVVTK